MCTCSTSVLSDRCQFDISSTTVQFIDKCVDQPLTGDNVTPVMPVMLFLDKFKIENVVTNLKFHSMPTPRNAESRIPRFSTQRSDKRKLYAKASAYQLAALLSEIQFFCKISPSFDQRELTRERPSHSSLPSSCVAATNGAGLSHGTSRKEKK